MPYKYCMFSPFDAREIRSLQDSQEKPYNVTGCIPRRSGMVVSICEAVVAQYTNEGKLSGKIGKTCGLVISLFRLLPFHTLATRDLDRSSHPPYDAGSAGCTSRFPLTAMRTCTLEKRPLPHPPSTT